MKQMNEVAGQGNFSPSQVPQFQFEKTLQKQQAQLQDNPLMLRFAKSREHLKADPHRPIYHFTSPESNIHDPNGLCFWQGRWHLFYQAFPPEDSRIHWGHAFSEDLVYWQDLPYAIYPHPEESAYSGATWVEENRVIAMYHGLGVGNIVAISDDPLLLNWEKIAAPAIPTKSTFGDPLPYFVFDPSIWKKDGTYYSLSGVGLINDRPAGKPVRSSPLFRSENLIDWQYLHEFVENDRSSLM
jgi:beta-fructofuranosidase